MPQYCLFSNPSDVKSWDAKLFLKNVNDVMFLASLFTAACSSDGMRMGAVFTCTRIKLAQWHKARPRRAPGICRPALTCYWKSGASSSPLSTRLTLQSILQILLLLVSVMFYKTILHVEASGHLDYFGRAVRRRKMYSFYIYKLVAIHFSYLGDNCNALSRETVLWTKKLPRSSISMRLGRYHSKVNNPQKQHRTLAVSILCTISLTQS